MFGAQISRLAFLRRGWIIELHQTVEEDLRSTFPQLRKGNLPSRRRAASLVDVKEELTAYPKEIGDLELKKCMADYDLQPEEILEDLPYSTLIRVAMAKLMLWKPDVLLLDDVTEDLEKATSDVDDINKACSWLEDFLLSAESLKIVLIASHDRSFMDKVCHKVIAIEENHYTTRVLEGNYGRAYLAGGDFLHFHSFSLWQPKSSGLRATQAACAFASLVVKDFLCNKDVTDTDRKWKIVDVGTGTGILSLILAQQFHRHLEPKETLEMFELWAIDLDQAALDIASVNFDRSPWRQQIFTYQGDFRTWKPQWKDPPKTFICNPPYNDDATVHRKSGSIVEDLSRRRALERSFLPLEELCLEVAEQGCESLWILWGNMEVP